MFMRETGQCRKSLELAHGRQPLVKVRARFHAPPLYCEPPDRRPENKRRYRPEDRIPPGIQFIEQPLQPRDSSRCRMPLDFHRALQLNQAWNSPCSMICNSSARFARSSAGLSTSRITFLSREF